MLVVLLMEDSRAAIIPSIRVDASSIVTRKLRARRHHIETRDERVHGMKSLSRAIFPNVLVPTGSQLA